MTEIKLVSAQSRQERALAILQDHAQEQAIRQAADKRWKARHANLAQSTLYVVCGLMTAILLEAYALWRVYSQCHP